MKVDYPVYRCETCGRSPKGQLLRRVGARKLEWHNQCRRCERGVVLARDLPEDENVTKVCTLCHQGFPATGEYFHYHEAGSRGLTSRCRPCLNELSNQYRKAKNEAATNG